MSYMTIDDLHMTPEPSAVDSDNYYSLLVVVCQLCIAYVIYNQVI